MTQNFFGKDFFLVKVFLTPKIVYEPNSFCSKIIFGQKFLLTLIVLTLYFFYIFWLIFHDSIEIKT